MKVFRLVEFTTLTSNLDNVAKQYELLQVLSSIHSIYIKKNP